MPILLTNNEARVLGCLMEKEATTPDYYPLSLNALMNACNQKSNREPVMTFDEGAVRDAPIVGSPSTSIASSRSISAGERARFFAFYCCGVRKHRASFVGAPNEHIDLKISTRCKPHCSI